MIGSGSAGSPVARLVDHDTGIGKWRRPTFGSLVIGCGSLNRVPHGLMPSAPPRLIEHPDNVGVPLLGVNRIIVAGNHPDKSRHTKASAACRRAVNLHHAVRVHLPWV
jgi:hypothetical protein